MKKPILLFDVDGVLLNGRSFTIQLEHDHGISYEMVQPFFKGPFQDATVGTQDLKQIIEPYLAKWGWNQSTQAFLDYWFKAEHVIDEPLVHYIQGLRAENTHCFLATNQEKYRAAYLLNEIGFKDSFDGLFASGDLGVKKPDPLFFKAVHDSLVGVEKEDILFWDDLPENISACQTYGIEAELYTNFEDFKQRMVDYV